MSNILHTSSAWFTKKSPGANDAWQSQFNASDTFDRYINIANNLRTIENSFYRQFTNSRYTCNNFNDFINMIRDILNTSEGDKAAFQNFQKDNLTTILRLWARNLSDPFYAAKYADITIKLDKTQYNNSINQIEAELQQLIKGTGATNKSSYGSFIYCTTSISDYEIHMPHAYLSTENIGILLDKVFNKRNEKINKSFNNRSQNIQAIQELQTEFGKSINDIIVFDQSELDASNVSVFQEYINVTNMPIWNYSKKDWLEAEKNDKSELYQELERVKFQIYDFLLQYIFPTASPELINAFKELWNTQISPIFSSGRFFTRGANFIDGLGGALGEFQGALLPLYIKHKGGNDIITPILMDLIGDESELGKSDVNLETILGTFGVQMKNISLNTTSISVNIHPNKLPMPIADYMINGAFNTSIGFNKAELETILKDHIPEILHIAGSSIPQTLADIPTDSVSFYIIGARYIVPASSILETFSMQQLTKKKLVNITNSYSGKAKSDEEYKSLDGKGDPLFLKYWENHGGSGVPKWVWVGENSWDNVNNLISISTEIKLNNFSNMNSFSIF